MRPAVSLLLWTLWSGTAAASTTFPAKVDEHLKLSGAETIEMKVAPPDGCLLCHVSEVGGLGSNNTFGLKLKQNGAVGAEPSTVDPALDAIEATNPHVIDDIVMGINPNDDHAIPTVALPSPRYGCSAARAGAAQPTGWASALLVLVSLLAHRVRRRAKPAG